MEQPNLYDILEVNPRANKAVIDAAYRALRPLAAKNPSVEKALTRGSQLKEAHVVLSDPDKRAEYDESINRLEGKIVGNYRILSLISDGKFARTYKAEQLLAEELVCIKQCKGITPEDDEILIREAKAVWNLRYYTLPIMRDMFRLPDSSLALVMSYIPGETIEQKVKRIGRIDPEEVCWTAERVISGLQYMHFNKLIHGGIEPGNIIVEDENHMASLIDFRFSVFDPVRYPGSNGYIPYFVAPEQIQNPDDPKLPLLPETDFYGLGKTMIYALTGSLESVERNQVPEFVPTPLREFIARLTQPFVLDRPSWDKENLIEVLGNVREKSFGRRRSRG